MMIKGYFIIFSDSKSAFQDIWVRDSTHSLFLRILVCLHWLVQYQENFFFIIPSHIGIRGNDNVRGLR